MFPYLKSLAANKKERLLYTAGAQKSEPLKQGIYGFVEPGIPQIHVGDPADIH